MRKKRKKEKNSSMNNLMTGGEGNKGGEVEVEPQSWSFPVRDQREN